MARQNIDEEWKTDPRRRALVKKLGSERLADGMRVEINWLVLDHRGQPVPLKKFKFIDNWKDWIDCALAEIKGDFVHVAGADRYQDFFDKQKNNASKGGKARAAKSKQTVDKRAQKKPKLPKAAQTSPECPSFSFSSSFSSSISDSSTISDFSLNPADSNKKPISLYCELWKAKYNARAVVAGKEAGIITQLVKDLGEKRVCELIEGYLRHPSLFFAERRHDLGTFRLRLGDVSHFIDTGSFVNRKQLQEAEDTQHYEAKYQPTAKDQEEIAAILNSAPKKQIALIGGRDD